MADNNKTIEQYIHELEELKKTSSIYLKNIDEIHNILKNARKILGKTSEDLKVNLQNPELQQYYENLTRLVEDLQSAQERYASSVNKVSKKFMTVDDEDVEKLFKYKNALEEAYKEYEKFDKQVERKAQNRGLSKDAYLNDPSNNKDKATYESLNQKYVETAKAFNQYVHNNSELLYIATELNNTNSAISKNYKKFNKELKNSKSLTEDINNLTHETNEKTREVADNQKLVNEQLHIAKERWSLIRGFAQGVWQSVKDSTKALMKYETVAYSTAKAMGMTASQAESLHKHNLTAIPKLANTFGLAAEEVAKFQENYSKATSKAIRLNETQAKTYAAIVKMVGAETTETAVEGFDALGGSMEAVGEGVYDLMKKATQQGLNLAKASSDMTKNLKLAQKYNFRDGVEGINKMTLLSQRLKFNMESIATAADNMNTVEGAITTAANMQKLGGSFSMQYSDPMRVLYESLNDFESVAERIAKTYEGKAYFDRDKGVVNMSSYNRRMLAESAKILGISYDDAWGMASQQAKYKDMEKEFTNTSLTKEQKEAISNRATYDKKNGWSVTYFDKNGEEQIKKLSEIDSSMAEQIIKGNATEEAMLDKLSNIEALMMKAQGYKTLEEGFQAIRDMKEAAQANVMEPVRGTLKGLTNQISTFMSEHLKLTGFATLALGGLGGMHIGRRMGRSLGKGYANTARQYGPASSSRKRIGGGIKNIFKDIGNFFSKKTSTSSSTVASSATSSATSSAANNGGRIVSKLSKFGKWGKIIGLGATAIGAATLLMSNSSGEEVDRSTLNTTNNNNLTKTNTSISNNNQSSINKNYSSDNEAALEKVLAKREQNRTIGSANEEVDRSTLNTTNNNNLAKINTNISNNNQSSINKNYSSVEEAALEKVLAKREQNRTIGSVGGSIIGGFLGSSIPIPVIGSLLGGAIGNTVGAALGHFLSPSMSKVLHGERTKNRVNSYSYETSKFGQAEITNENMMPLIAQASIKSSDTLASIYELLVNNFDKNFRKELDKSVDKQYKNEIKKKENLGIFDFIGFTNGGIVRAENGLNRIPGNSFSGDRVLARVNSGEMILNPQQQTTLFNVMNGSVNSVIKPLNNEYSKATEIIKSTHTNTLNNNSFSSSQLKFDDINVNINGNISLNANNQQINLKELLNDPTFKREISNMILLQMSKNVNGGRVNYNDSRTRQGSFF